MNPPASSTNPEVSPRQQLAIANPSGHPAAYAPGRRGLATLISTLIWPKFTWRLGGVSEEGQRSVPEGLRAAGGLRVRVVLLPASVQPQPIGAPARDRAALAWAAMRV